MKKTVSIIGGGPAALLLAAHLDTNLFNVTIYEKNKALGRKFLVAGKGGFNLSHSEELSTFISQYTPPDFLEDAITFFSNTDLRKWLEAIKISTFIGSSKRIYPKEGIKPISVLNAILDQLQKKNIFFKTQCNFVDWNDSGDLKFENGSVITSDISIFSMGGSSWRRTGSSGEWTNSFSKAGINIIPFKPSNCAYEIKWKTDFLQKNEGKPLKNIEISCQTKNKKGEVVITCFGIEGGAIYALSPEIRRELTHEKKAKIHIDLKPSMSLGLIISKLSAGKITAQLSKIIKLEKPKIDLLKIYLNKEEFLDIEILAGYIKKFPLEITSLSPIDEAISTFGGIALEEVNKNFELIKKPNNYSIGEMLSYDAPTGGYLLQSCFSMGVYLANHLNKKYEQKN